MKKLKKIPKFRTEAAERKFWASHDSTEYIDWPKAKPVLFSNLKNLPADRRQGDTSNRKRE